MLRVLALYSNGTLTDTCSSVGEELTIGSTSIDRRLSICLKILFSLEVIVKAAVVLSVIISQKGE